MPRIDEKTVALNGKGLAAHLSSYLMLTASEAAASVRISLRQWRRLDATGKVPAAVVIGRAKRWRADELRRWVELGCPDRAAWKAITNESDNK